MKNNTVKLLGLLAVLVVVYLIMTFTGDKSRSKSFRTELVSIDTASVTRVVIESPTESTEVTKDGEGWQVALPDGSMKSAVASAVSNLLTSLEGIKPTRIVARTENKWKDYSVDSTGTRVKIYEGNKNTLDLIIGRFGVENQRQFYTHVRLAEENDVYIANDFMGISIAKSANDFRNGSLLRLKQDSLTQISFNYPDSAFSLYKNDARWSTNAFEADSANVASYLQGLSFVSSKNFADGAGLSTPDLNVTFSFSNQPEIQISAYQQDGNWILQSSENTDEYFTDAAVFEKIFKGAAVL
ncbi:MAG: DUF4340 domain-containing protein [Cytophagales bacterium]|nr:DUF4340 domain-containing protein [Cytophagales bacterium]